MHQAILIRTLIILGILAALGVTILGVNEYMAHRELAQQMETFTGEYRSLAETCLKKKTQTCCLSSVASMQKSGGHIIPDKGCAPGYIPDSVRCIGAYSWCEKTPEKNPNDDPVLPKNINIYS